MLRTLIGFLGLLILPMMTQAHEVQPAIADMQVRDGQLELSFSLNAEALVAGVNLDGLFDTDEAEDNARVDALRALEPGLLLVELTGAAPRILSQIGITADGQPVSLAVTDATTEPVGNVDLPRLTQITLTGALPVGAQTVELMWPASFGIMILRQQGVEAPYTGTLSGGVSSGPIPLGGGQTPGGWTVFGQYIPVGFDHILPKGLDHILFVLGVFFLSTRLRPLVFQVTAFTAAHTVTLGLAALGYVSISPDIVEPLIAASIVYVAVENVLTPKLHRWRTAIIFGFGLLHGLGFATVLGVYGLPEGQVVPALLGFNIGVELGQLTVIALAFLVVWLAIRVDHGLAKVQTAQVFYGLLALVMIGAGFALNTAGFEAVMGASAPVFLWPIAGLAMLCAASATFVDQLGAYRRFVVIPASVAIAAVGANWFVERVFL